MGTPGSLPPSLERTRVAPTHEIAAAIPDGSASTEPAAPEDDDATIGSRAPSVAGPARADARGTTRRRGRSRLLLWVAAIVLPLVAGMAVAFALMRGTDVPAPSASDDRGTSDP